MYAPGTGGGAGGSEPSRPFSGIPDAWSSSAYATHPVVRRTGRFLSRIQGVSGIISEHLADTRPRW
jgi:hypothetical protein